MRLYGLLYTMLLCFLIACNDEPVSPSWANAPGMPDWYSDKYNWIDSAYEKCANTPFFQPDVIINVGGISPDGKTLLCVFKTRELFLYNIETHQITKRLGESILGFHDARWSVDGQYILGSHLLSSLNPNVMYAPYLYNVQEGTGTLLEVSDSLQPTGRNIDFAPDNTSIILHKYIKDPIIFPPFYRYTFDKVVHNLSFINATGNIAVAHPSSYLWFRHYYISSTFSESVDLRVALLNHTQDVNTFYLSGVLRVGRAQLSRDGNWLSALMEVQLPGDRFLSASTITGLGIIDLRLGSPYQYKLYAFYPDHTNTHKLCSNGFSLAGSAWSSDNRYVYHEQIRLSDTTVQIVRREVSTGRVEVLTNFKGVP